MSCANNHFSDDGRQGILQTLDLLAQHGIDTCGAGPTAAAAGTPAIVRAKGRQIGFLAYTAVRDQNTKGSLPEIANVHAETSYVNIEPNQPGTPPLISTKTRPSDLARVTQDVQAIRGSVDLLFVSFHWGIHFLPYVIADYERELAHAVIEAGADGVLGHHQHILKGIEFYRNRPIFYGLGDLAIVDHRPLSEEVFPSLSEEFRRYGEYRPRRYPGWNSLKHPLSRMRVIARYVFREDQAASVELVLCKIDRWSRPIPYHPETPTAKRIIEYLREANELAGLTTTLRYAGKGPYVGVRASP